MRFFLLAECLTFENMNDIPVPKVNDDDNEDFALDTNSEKVCTKEHTFYH